MGIFSPHKQQEYFFKSSLRLKLTYFVGGGGGV
jgi:hypothetical protein